jgi:hypothetical protein
VLLELELERELPAFSILELELEPELEPELLALSPLELQLKL